MTSLPALTVAIYSAFVVDKATTFCHLGCQETAPPAYGILFISAFSIFVFGHWPSDSFLFVNNVEPTSLASCMLNLWSTFVTYFSSDNHNNLFFQSRITCIPKIYLAGPISFIAKEFPKAFFRLLIFFRSCLTISMSSTYNRRIRKSPPSHFFTKT